MKSLLPFGNKNIMKKIRMSWRQTTTDKFLCNSCHKNVKGSNGYISIRNGDMYYSGSYVDVKYCIECFNKMTNIKIPNNKDEKYELIIRKRMLMKLKGKQKK